MWELDGKDDGLLERLLGRFQAGHVAPLDVRLLHHDRVAQLALHLLLLRVVVVRVSVGVCRILEVRNLIKCFMVCPCESKEVHLCQLVNQSKHIKACLGTALVTVFNQRGPPLALR